MDFWFPFLGWVDLFLVCCNPLFLLLQIWTKLREGLWEEGRVQGGKGVVHQCDKEALHV